MKKNLLFLGLGFAAGLATAFMLIRSPARGLTAEGRRSGPLEIPTTCYSCLWEGYGPQLRNDVIEFYRQYRSQDRLVMADVRYILWRASNNPNCDAREEYRAVATTDPDPQRKLVAYSILGMGARECGEDGTAELRSAAGLAGQLGLTAESAELMSVSRNALKPVVERAEIERVLRVPAGATTMILGESRIEISPGMRIGTQVDRVARDWVSYQMKWDMSREPLKPQQLINYHEGAVLKEVASRTPVEVYPLTGTVVANINGQWFAPDEQGHFRFNVLADKVQFPTTHQREDTAWIEDTHGISVLVEQALQRHMQMVVGCGDSEGKAEAANYLSHRGIHVVFPGDRYQDLLLGYTGNGVLMGTAPVKEIEGRTVIGGQPVRFGLQETIMVEDTNRAFPVQYYDAAARYFKRLGSFAPLKTVYVLVDGPDEVDKVLEQAKKTRSSAVAVRVATLKEAMQLRDWLGHSTQNRAILFHSGLYPYAQPLFRDFPRQVTFGDLHPRFE